LRAAPNHSPGQAQGECGGECRWSLASHREACRYV